MKKLISAALVAAVCVSCTACAKTPDMSDVFKDNEKISYSTSYTQLSDKKTNKTKSWRQGMVGGNGLRALSQAEVRTAIRLYTRICISLCLTKTPEPVPIRHTSLKR